MVELLCLRPLNSDFLEREKEKKEYFYGLNSSTLSSSRPELWCTVVEPNKKYYEHEHSDLREFCIARRERNTYLFYGDTRKCLDPYYITFL